MKTGLIDVGGGLRGVYAAGVLDRCLDEGVRFDYGIGISAGSANLASFLAGQRGRNLRFFRDYFPVFFYNGRNRERYMGIVTVRRFYNCYVIVHGIFYIRCVCRYDMVDCRNFIA